MSESSADESKTFNDPIHGTIVLDPFLVKIIDTPQFQRLRNIKQLGSVYYVYPGASHNRFEHSIGTAYLAGKVVRTLRKNLDCEDGEKDKYIDKKDILCVEVAGLCHDLGQGPFSYMFETLFMPHFKTDNGKKWNSKKWSCEMFDYLLEENGLDEDKEILSDKDRLFIKELMKPRKSSDSAIWKNKGREKEKSFLYEIVSNRRNGVDVDKWDYMARDSYHLGIPFSFDYKRFIKSLKVLKLDSELRQICARDKECFNLYEMFHARCTLHQKAYKHKNSNAIDHMICDAMIAVNDLGVDLLGMKISECCQDPVAFTKLNDCTLENILHLVHPETPALKTARDIIERISKRNLYQQVCIKTVKKHKGDKLEEVSLEDIAEKHKLKRADLVKTLISIDYGYENKNPIDNYRFYSKDEPTIPRKITKDMVSSLTPSVYEDIQIQIFSKHVNKSGYSADIPRLTLELDDRKKFVDLIPKVKYPAASVYIAGSNTTNINYKQFNMT